MLLEGVTPAGTPKALAVTPEGVFPPGVVATANVARVSASATAVTLLAANSSRRRVIIYNESTVALRIKLGSAASTTDYTYLLGAGDTYESPTDWVYTGIVTGIWDSATGAAQVTEI